MVRACALKQAIADRTEQQTQEQHSLPFVVPRFKQPFWHHHQQQRPEQKTCRAAVQHQQIAVIVIDLPHGSKAHVSLGERGAVMLEFHTRFKGDTPPLLSQPKRVNPIITINKQIGIREPCPQNPCPRNKEPYKRCDINRAGGFSDIIIR